MIDIIDTIVSEIADIEEVQGRAYRRWPKKNLAMPAVLISHMGRNPIYTDADGSEVVVDLSYSIDINAKDQESADIITEKVSDALARYNMHTVGHTDFYDDMLKVYRSIITVNGTVDIRGNTFTS